MFRAPNGAKLKLLADLAIIMASALLSAACLGRSQNFNEIKQIEFEDSPICLPEQADWQDQGTIISAGPEGEWDYYLWGGFAFSVIKKDETTFLYYQGASDYRTAFDETVLWRSIGVATSTDGIHFSKFEGNPVLTWFPNNNGEEGAVSSGAALDSAGDIILFYGANTQETPITVNADVRAAVSSDGLHFTDLGIALDRRDRSLWGGGDEIFAVDAQYAQGNWIVYYIPNGTSESGLLGAATGSGYDNLDQSYPVQDTNGPIAVWGAAGHTHLNDETFALALNNVRENRVEMRLANFAAPQFVSEPVATYRFEGVRQALPLLDEKRGEWLLYYRAENYYGVMTAPVNYRNAGYTCSP